MMASPGDAGSAHLYLVGDVTSCQLTCCLCYLRPLPEDCGNPEETEQRSAGGEGQRPGEVKGQRLKIIYTYILKLTCNYINLFDVL